MRIVTILAVVLCLTGCQGKKNDEAPKAQNQLSAQNPINVEKVIEEWKENDTMCDKDIYFHAENEYPSTQLFLDLEDVRNIYAIVFSLFDDLDLKTRFGADVTDAMKKIRTDVIHDEGIRSALQKMVDVCVEASKTDEPDLNNAGGIFMNEMQKRYPHDNYTDLSPEELAELTDWHQDVEDMDEVLKFRDRESDDKLPEFFHKKIKESQDNDEALAFYLTEYSFYGLEELPDSLLADFMTSGRYSHSIDYVWRVWRCHYQTRNCGLSTYSDIPNLYYNAMRDKCLNTILRRIVANPEDKVAILNFFYLASYPDMERLAGTLTGNGAMAEEISLSKVLLDDEEEEEE